MDEYVCPRCGTPARGASACAGCGAELDALSELPRASEYAAGGIAVLVAEHEAEDEAAAGAPASVLVRWIALVFDTVLGIFPRCSVRWRSYSSARTRRPARRSPCCSGSSPIRP